MYFCILAKYFIFLKLSWFTRDFNVHYQNTMLLAAALERAGEDWSVFQHGQKHFKFWTNTFWILKKYILNFAQVHFEFWTKTFWILNKPFWILNKSSLQGQSLRWYPTRMPVTSFLISLAHTFITPTLQLRISSWSVFWNRTVVD